MIDISDVGLRSGLETVVGHPNPFAPDELAAVTRLRVLHGSDLSELSTCTALSHLELVACDVLTLNDVAGLDRLRVLHVLACPTEDVAPLAGHPALEELRIDFCFLQDISPLTGIPQLQRGRFIGNPIDPESWSTTRPQWQRSRSDKTSQLRVLEFGAAQAWETTRLMWENGVRLGFGVLDGVRPVLVRPGIPARPGAAVDSCQADAGGLVIATQRGDSTEAIFRRNDEFAESQGQARPTDFSSHRVLGDAQDASNWLQPADEDDQQLLRRFIDRFPDQVFFREDDQVFAALAAQAGISVPKPLARSRAILAGALPDQGARFRLASYAGRSPRADHLQDIWYLPSAGVYSTAERRRLFLDQAEIFPIAEWIETGRSILGTRTAEDDPAIYEFGEQDLYDTLDEGRPITDALHPVFASHAEMLAHVDSFTLRDGSAIASVTADVEE